MVLNKNNKQITKLNHKQQTTRTYNRLPDPTLSISVLDLTTYEVRPTSTLNLIINTGRTKPSRIIHPTTKPNRTHQHMNLLSRMDPPAPKPWSGFPTHHHSLVLLLYSEQLVEGLLRDNGPSKIALSNVLGFADSHWLLLEQILLDMAEGDQMDPAGHNARMWDLYWQTIVKSLFTRLMSLVRGFRNELDTSSVHAGPELDELLTRGVTFLQTAWNTPPANTNTFIRTTAETAILARQILRAILESPHDQECTPVAFPMDLTSYFLWYICKQVREVFGARKNKVKRRACGKVMRKEVQRLSVRKADVGSVRELDENLRKEMQNSALAHDGQLEDLRKDLENQMQARLMEQDRKFEEKIAAVKNYTDGRLKEVEEQQEGTAQQLGNHIKVTDTRLSNLAQASAESGSKLSNIESMMKQMYMAQVGARRLTPPHSPCLGPITPNEPGVTGSNMNG